MNGENNKNFTIASSLSPEGRKKLYNETKEAKNRAKEVYRLQNDEWYIKLKNLFKLHNEDKSGETFLKPDDCPNDVFEQFCKDMIKRARDQGIDATQDTVLDEEAVLPSNHIELVDKKEVVPMELTNTKELKLNTILIGDEARADLLVQIRNSPEYKILLGQYQSGETSVEEFAKAVTALSSDDDPSSKATRVLFYDIKMGIVHPPDVAIQLGGGTKADDQKENGVVFKFKKGGLKVKPQAKKDKKDELSQVFKIPVVERLDVKKESVTENFYNPKELKVAADWLNEKITLSQEKKYFELREKELKAADERFIENTKDVWQYFIDAGKWTINKKNNAVYLKDKSDVDAKVTLGMLRQVGLEEKICKYIEQQDKVKSQTDGTEKVSWSSLEVGEGGLAGFDQGLSFPNQKVCAAEVLCKLLVAGGIYKENDEAPRIAAELAHRAVYNELLTNNDEFENSDKTTRGLLRFFDYGNLLIHIRIGFPKIRGENFEKRFNEFLDKPLSEDDLKHYFRQDNGKTIFDHQNEQIKTIEQAKAILEKSEAELITEGRIIESPIWGKIFVNVMNSAKDSFPGGASSVGAYGVADAYLNIDLEKNSFLFRPFGELTKEQKAKINLPGGQWAYNMYFKPRGDKSAFLSKEEILQQLGVEQSQTELNVQKVSADAVVVQSASNPETSQIVEPIITAKDELSKADGTAKLEQAEVGIDECNRLVAQAAEVLALAPKDHNYVSWGAKDLQSLAERLSNQDVVLSKTSEKMTGLRKLIGGDVSIDYSVFSALGDAWGKVNSCRGQLQTEVKKIELILADRKAVERIEDVDYGKFKHIEYLTVPSSEGFFWADKIHNTLDPLASAYKLLRASPNSKTAMYVPIDQDTDRQKTMIDSFATYLSPAADIEGTNTLGTNIMVLSPGELELKGDKWVITKKVKIRIINEPLKMKVKQTDINVVRKLDSEVIKSRDSEIDKETEQYTINLSQVDVSGVNTIQEIYQIVFQDHDNMPTYFVTDEQGNRYGMVEFTESIQKIFGGNPAALGEMTSTAILPKAGAVRSTVERLMQERIKDRQFIPEEEYFAKKIQEHNILTPREVERLVLYYKSKKMIDLISKDGYIKRLEQSGQKELLKQAEELKHSYLPIIPEQEAKKSLDDWLSNKSPQQFKEELQQLKPLVEYIGERIIARSPIDGGLQNALLLKIEYDDEDKPLKAIVRVGTLPEKLQTTAWEYRVVVDAIELARLNGMILDGAGEKETKPISRLEKIAPVVSEETKTLTPIKKEVVKPEILPPKTEAISFTRGLSPQERGLKNNIDNELRTALANSWRKHRVKIASSELTKLVDETMVDAKVIQALKERYQKAGLPVAAELS
ncbi:MAG: hypothetical protein V1712_03905 [Patescibacteria group bacterium]